LFYYDVGHQRKIEGRTAFENTILGNWEKVSRIFASVLKMMKSRDLFSITLKGQAFKPYRLTFNL